MKINFLDVLLNEYNENIIPLHKVPALHKITVLIAFFMISAFYADADEFWRIRYSVPTSGESEIKRGSNIASEKLNTSGHSGNMVFPNGIGFGYSSVHTDGSLSEIEYKFKNHSLDLTYTIGNELSLTLGAGRLVYGRGRGRGKGGSAWCPRASARSRG